MNLHLIRKWFTDQSTIGGLYIDGYWECFCLEDAVRIGLKIPDKTAIPEGIYKVIINHSPRFDKDLPLLLDVPGFEGVRIHSGNSAKDTSGCILVGQSRGHDWIAQSRAAFDLLFAKLQTAHKAGIDITIEITSEAIS